MRTVRCSGRLVGGGVSACGGGYCSDQAIYYALGVELGSSQWVRSVDLKQLTVMVIKQSLGSWSRLWSLSNVSGCGSTSLFGSRAGTHQIRDQSRALEDRNDSNNSLEVYTPNSFIHLLYNSPDMDIVDMHSVIVTPSDSVL